MIKRIFSFFPTLLLPSFTSLGSALNLQTGAKMLPHMPSAIGSFFEKMIGRCLPVTHCVL